MCVGRKANLEWEEGSIQFWNIFSLLRQQFCSVYYCRIAQLLTHVIVINLFPFVSILVYPRRKSLLTCFLSLSIKYQMIYLSVDVI